MSYVEGGDTAGEEGSRKRKRRPADDTVELGDGKMAKPWLDRIDAAIEREREWRDKSRKVVERYRASGKGGRKRSGGVSSVNILWANTEVLRSALYSRTAIPDVRRRFPDAKGGDPVARTAAEVIERALNYVIDMYDLDSAVDDALSDYLLPGRGTVWVDYEPEIIGEGEEATVGEQRLACAFVYWKDFVHGKARTWATVPWVARRQAVPLGVFRKMFPHITEEPDLSTTLLDNDERNRGSSAMADEDGLVELWQIWDKGSMDRIYVARGFKLEVERKHDPLRLQGFFPCPRPLYSVKTTDHLIPEPEFCLYQDQADELDRVSSRIRVLTEAMRWKGIYDGSIDGDNVLQTLSEAGDNVFLPYPNWSVLQEKGGIDQAVGFWPLAAIAKVLTQLYPRAAQLIQEIYEITGISDVIRGATDPNETLGAQKLKSQFGSMRMQKRQREVQRFVRDDYRIKAEIISEHFTQETLQTITNIQLPTKEEQLQAQAQLEQLQLAQQEAAAAAQAGPPPGMGHNGGPPMEAEPPPMPPLPPMPGMMPPEGMPPPGMNGATPPPALLPGMEMPPQGMGEGGMPPPMGAGAPLVPAAPAPGMSPSPMPEEALPEEAEGVEASEPAEPDENEEDEKIKELEAIINSPTWDEVMELLRADKLRGTRVDVETDSTVLLDAEAEKQARIEFMTAAQGMLQASMEMITVAPSTIPLVKEMFLFGIRSFKVGRALEQAFEDAFDELSKNPPSPPDDGTAGAEAEAASRQAEIAAKVKEIDTKYGIEAEKAKADVGHKQSSLDLEAQKAVDEHNFRMAQLALEQSKVDLQREQIAAAAAQALQSHQMAMSAADQSHQLALRGTALEERKHDETHGLAVQQQELAERSADTDAGFRDQEFGLKTAAQNKQLIDDATGEAIAMEDAAVRDVTGLEQISQGMQAMAKMLSDAMLVQSQMIAKGFAQQGEQMNEMAAAITAPKHIVVDRDPVTNRIVSADVAPQPLQ